MDIKSDLISEMSSLGIQSINHDDIETTSNIDLLLNKEYEIDLDIGNIDTKDYDYYHNLKTPPHDVPLYKNMMKLYLGVGGYALNEKPKRVDESYLSHYGSLNSKKCSGESVSLDNPEINFKLILMTRCWNKGCSPKAKTFFFEKDNDLIIYFNIGVITVNYPIDYTELFEWLEDEDVTNILFDKKYKKIYLFGHSNGMVSATLLSYYLMKQNIVYKQKHSNISYEDDLFVPKIDITNKISICGTGGFPEIFNNELEFIEYYNFYKGRYLHISSAMYYDYESSASASTSDDDVNSNTLVYNIIGTNIFYTDVFTEDINQTDSLTFRNYKMFLYHKTISDIRNGKGKNNCYTGLLLNENFYSEDEYNIELYKNSIKLDKKNFLLRTVMTLVHEFSYYRSMLISHFL